MVHYDDKTKMPFGECRGMALGSVPASKLLWYYRNYPISCSLKTYIERRMKTLTQQAKTTRKVCAR